MSPARFDYHTEFSPPHLPRSIGGWSANRNNQMSTSSIGKILKSTEVGSIKRASYHLAIGVCCVRPGLSPYTENDHSFSARFPSHMQRFRPHRNILMLFRSVGNFANTSPTTPHLARSSFGQR